MVIWIFINIYKDLYNIYDRSTIRYRTVQSEVFSVLTQNDLYVRFIYIYTYATSYKSKLDYLGITVQRITENGTRRIRPSQKQKK